MKADPTVEMRGEEGVMYFLPLPTPRTPSIIKKKKERRKKERRRKSRNAKSRHREERPPQMGCGASTEFMNDPSSSSSSLQMSLSNPNSSKRRFIDACREQLHLAMADATCKSIANSTISPHHQAYVHLSDGDVEGSSSSSRNHGGPNRGRNADHVMTGMSHDNDSEEYLENKPPSNQQVTPINHQSPSPNPNPNPNPRKSSPLQEISITSHGKLVGLVKDFDTKDGHGHGHVECPGNVISTSSSSGCSARFPPPRPPSGAKQIPKLCHSSSSSSLVRDSLIPPTPIQAWLCDYNSLPSKEPVEDVVVVDDDDAKNLMGKFKTKSFLSYPFGFWFLVFGFWFFVHIACLCGI